MDVKYAGFWARAVAYMIDYFILTFIVAAFFILLALVAVLLGLEEPVSDTVSGLLGLTIIIFSFVGRWLYFALQHSSDHEATLGMRAMGFHIEGEHGEQISFAQASGRYFAGILSTLIFYIGYFMIGWTRKKQGLHDIIAGTYTVYDDSYDDIVLEKEQL